MILDEILSQGKNIPFQRESDANHFWELYEDGSIREYRWNDKRRDKCLGVYWSIKEFKENYYFTKYYDDWFVIREDDEKVKQFEEWTQYVLDTEEGMSDDFWSLHSKTVRAVNEKWEIFDYMFESLKTKFEEET